MKKFTAIGLSLPIEIAQKIETERKFDVIDISLQQAIFLFLIPMNR